MRALCCLLLWSCSNKVIGCRWYADDFGGGKGVLENLPYEFLSCQDVSAGNKLGVQQ